MRPAGQQPAAGNQPGDGDDWTAVSCELWREAISAGADGEDSQTDPRLLAAHLQTCPDCRAFEASVGVTRRLLRIGVAPPTPDLASRITALNAMHDRRSAWQIARWGLAVVAVQIIVFAVPELLGRDGTSSVHAARHIGAFTAAYAVGLLVVVVRPARARTMIPVAAVLSGALVITAVVDLVTGDAPFVSEISHLPELASLGLLWLLHRPVTAPPVASSGDIERARAALRLVGDPSTGSAVDGAAGGRRSTESA